MAAPAPALERGGLNAVGGAGEEKKVKPATGLTVEHVVLQHDTDSRSLPWASRWRGDRSGFDALFGGPGCARDG